MGKLYNVWHLWEDKSYLVTTKAEAEASRLVERLQELSYHGKLLPEAKYSNAFMALRTGTEADLICRDRMVFEPPVDYLKVMKEN